MHISLPCTTGDAKVEIVINTVNKPFAVLNFYQESGYYLTVYLDRPEVQQIAAALMECDENWPTEPPPEAPTAEDERGLNHERTET